MGRMQLMNKDKLQFWGKTEAENRKLLFSFL